jgi:3-oxoacyl-[acyl-carrier-protein] synthase-1
MCDAVIVGGSDSLCKMTLNGFDCLDLISQDICNPFSQNRKGLNIGEGAALFILSKQTSGIALTGIGESSDGHHISTPDPEAKGAESAIKQALDMAGHQACDVGYINLHGTATGKNDEMESLVIHRIFGDQTPCSSTKSLLGHTLGAAAAHELGLCWLLLSEAYNPKQQLPEQVWDGVYDEGLMPINITKPNTQYINPIMMSNSFAFGGSNVSLVIEKNIQDKAGKR